MANASSSSVLEFRGITKTFPGVVALDNVSFSVARGEIHALVGENGAGKSTLVKVLTGVTLKDQGAIYIDNKPVEIRNTKDAIELGIRCIYQELPLAASLSVADNIFLGQELKKAFFIDRSTQYRFVRRYFEEYGISIDPAIQVAKLSVSMQQIVAIIKATMKDLRLLLMDEPTATLGEKETNSLFAFMKRMKQKGLTILYISHRLDEIFEVCDYVTVLRDGMYQGTRTTGELTRDSLITMMSGKDIHDSTLVFDSERKVDEQAVLEVRNLCSCDLIRDVSFNVRKGEIFGICGRVGAGKTELLKTIYGLHPAQSGSILLKGDDKAESRRSATKRAMVFGLVPEDRKKEGLFLDLGISLNITISSLRQLLRLIFIRRTREGQLVEHLVSDLGIKLRSPKQPVSTLSGGNQQKVVFAKWLGANRGFLMLDEPTRGVDVFGKTEIYKLINKLSHQGISIILASSEIPEVMGICDRIGVLYQGSLVSILDRRDFSKEAILRMMIGSHASASATAN